MPQDRLSIPTGRVAESEASLGHNQLSTYCDDWEELNDQATISFSNFPRQTLKTTWLTNYLIGKGTLESGAATNLQRRDTSKSAEIWEEVTKISPFADGLNISTYCYLRVVYRIQWR